MNFNNTLPVSSWTHCTNKFILDNSSDLANGHLPKNQLQLTQTGFDWINTARKYRAKKLFWAKFERTPAFPDLLALHATPNVTDTLLVTFVSQHLPICAQRNENVSQNKKNSVELEAPFSRILQILQPLESFFLPWNFPLISFYFNIKQSKCLQAMIGYIGLFSTLTICTSSRSRERISSPSG